VQRRRFFQWLTLSNTVTLKPAKESLRALTRPTGPAPDTNTCVFIFDFELEQYRQDTTKKLGLSKGPAQFPLE
jgi:hypothetical protein